MPPDRRGGTASEYSPSNRSPRRHEDAAAPNIQQSRAPCGPIRPKESASAIVLLRRAGSRMNEQLANKIRECQNLPTLPSIAMQVLELVQDPDADIPKLARLVSKDPALSSRILKTVNSSLYARPQKISKLTQALTLLGLQTVRVLVLGFSLARNVNNSRHKGFNPLHYWRRSIYSATAALTL